MRGRLSQYLPSLSMQKSPWFGLGVIAERGIDAPASRRPVDADELCRRTYDKSSNRPDLAWELA